MRKTRDEFLSLGVCCTIWYNERFYYLYGLEFYLRFKLRKGIIIKPHMIDESSSSFNESDLIHQITYLLIETNR